MDQLSYSKTGRVALGIGVHHDAAVALCDQSGIVCAVQEERVSRIKHHYGFPYQALDTVLRYTAIDPGEIDVVAFGRREPLYPDYKATIVVDADGELISGDELTRRFGTGGVPSGLSRREKFEFLRPVWGEFADRHWIFAKELLLDLGLMNGRTKHYCVAHHRAHAASAFRLSGLREATVITVDGKGDGLSATTYRGQVNGGMTLLRRSTAKNSLGSFYQAATEVLGFIPVDGEYKTMGLAALGTPDGCPNPVESVVSVKNGEFHSSIPWTFRRYNEAYPEKKIPNPLGSVAESDDFGDLLRRYSREDFAFYVQEHCENNLLRYFEDAILKTGCPSLACAGGVLLNVKANALIEEKLRPSKFFVFPDSADSGLAAGAALEALHQEGWLHGAVSFGDPYLGHSFTEGDIEAAIERCEHRDRLLCERTSPRRVASCLARGRVIGSFQGRMEVGPRALGNRSVLADPRSNEIKDRINLLLKGREPFVPFAPIVLKEDAGRYWHGPVDYHYMTFAVEATEYSKNNVPAAVHVDGTLRPQVVSSEWNPWMAAVLGEFKALTGEGLLINTSFNRHGQPIVGSPDDALDHLMNGWVEGLAMGDWYVSKT